MYVASLLLKHSKDDLIFDVHIVHAHCTRIKSTSWLTDEWVGVGNIAYMRKILNLTVIVVVLYAHVIMYKTIAYRHSYTFNNIAGLTYEI